MNTPIEDIRGKGWKEAAFTWAANQGVSTVILLLILAMLWFGQERFAESMQEGYDRNAKELTNNTERTEKTVERLLTYIEKRERLSDDQS